MPLLRMPAPPIQPKIHKKYSEYRPASLNISGSLCLDARGQEKKFQGDVHPRCVGISVWVVDCLQLFVLLFQAFLIHIKAFLLAASHPFACHRQGLCCHYNT